eukprot:579348-Pyramimonas_sp.AAC.1
MYQLQGITPDFWRWLGLLWAFTCVYMRGAALVINKSLGAAKHCDDIATGIQEARSRGQAAEAFAALRRVGAGSRRKRMLKGLPILKDMHAQP